jgi:hypothetical protein
MGSPGMDNVRWLKLVRPGDTLLTMQGWGMFGRRPPQPLP